ncbi:hypothetical protein E2C01_056149 [Portunus trituberculatus]|uniref:Uncharacterized protein n=1 Tax=Portunus trituberculatus TaxID=210409 RepID=A0A5B7GX36_PORTR|nr:hypothetical protein [Portunus trituberculatus]
MLDDGDDGGDSGLGQLQDSDNEIGTLIPSWHLIPSHFSKDKLFLGLSSFNSPSLGVAGYLEDITMGSFQN